MKNIEYPAPKTNENIYKLDRNYEVQLQFKLSQQQQQQQQVKANAEALEKQKFLKRRVVNSQNKMVSANSEPSFKSQLSLQNNNDAENPLVMNYRFFYYYTLKCGFMSNFLAAACHTIKCITTTDVWSVQINA